MDNQTIVLLIIIIPLFVLTTLYRMWINSKILRIKYDYKDPGYYVGKDFSKQELEKEQEASFFILFSFFSFFWLPGSREVYGTLRVRSNTLSFLSLVLFAIVWYLIIS